MQRLFVLWREIRADIFMRLPIEFGIKTSDFLVAIKVLKRLLVSLKWKGKKAGYDPLL